MAHRAQLYIIVVASWSIARDAAHLRYGAGHLKPFVPVEEVEKETWNTVHRMEGVDFLAMISGGYRFVWDAFLPGVRFQGSAVTVYLMLIGVTWFYVWYRLLYKPDHSNGWPTWMENLDTLEDMRISSLDGRHAGEKLALEFSPDLVLVFNHPDCTTYSDSKVELASNAFERALVKRGESSDWCDIKFDRLEKLKSASQVKTMAEARTALLQDMGDNFSRMGFQWSAFSSIDGDEIFLYVRIADNEVIGHYLEMHQEQVQIRHHVVDLLGIVQPRDAAASSPPFLPYDPVLVKKLHIAGVLDSDDPCELYRQFHVHGASGESARERRITSGKNRIRLMVRELAKYVDLNEAKNAGLLKDWFPGHGCTWCKTFRQAWGNWALLFDYTFEQPIEVLHEYFGSRVAFSSAWMGLYCKALFALMPCALVSEAIVILFPHVAKNTVVAGFSMLILIWVRVVSNLWDCEHAYFVKLWNLDAEAAAMNYNDEMPGFQGTFLPSVADKKCLSKQCSPFKRNILQTCSTIITISLCLLCALCLVIWYNMFEGRMNIVATIFLAIQIKIWDFAYNRVATRLTELENHKFEHDYYNGYLWKQFLFQSVNRYSPFFYLAINQRYSAKGCPEGGCLNALQMQLTMALAILSFSSIAEVLFASRIVVLKLWWERRQLGEAAPMQKFAERESKFGVFNLEEQVNAMLQPVLSLGFVVLFGGVAPIIVPFCLFVFVVQLRATAWMLVNCVKRPVPATMNGIGLWRDVVKGLVNVGKFSSAVLLVTYGQTWQDAPVRARVTGFVLFYLGMGLVWSVVDWVVPASNKVTLDMAACRFYVRQKISTKVAGHLHTDNYDKNLARVRKMVEVGAQHLSLGASCVGEGQWSKVPLLA